MRFAQTTALGERRQFQILRLNADGRSDVVANQIEPRELFGAKLDAGFCLVHEPFVEPLGYGVGEGREDGLLFQRKADERDESHQSSHRAFSSGVMRCARAFSRRRSKAWLRN